MSERTRVPSYNVSSFFMWCLIGKLGCDPFGPSKLLCGNLAQLLDVDISSRAVKSGLLVSHIRLTSLSMYTPPNILGWWDLHGVMDYSFMESKLHLIRVRDRKY